MSPTPDSCCLDLNALRNLIALRYCLTCTHHIKPPSAASYCPLLLQRVVYDGEEMPASRFEVLAGKPDAKKWKTSLSFVGPDGRPAEVSGGARRRQWM